MLLATDIGSGNIYFVEGDYKSGIIEIVNNAEAKLLPNTVVDGSIKNYASMIMLINKLLVSGNFKTSSSVITFNSSSLLSRRLELPMSKPRELAAMVKTEMIQMANETSEIVVEYSIIKEVLQKNSYVNIWAYAINKDLVDEYYTLYRNLRLKPVALEVHPNSVEKLFTDAEINGEDLNEKSVLFGDIGASTIEIHLFSDNERAFSRITPLKASEFEALLANMGYKKGENAFETLDITPAALKEDNTLADIVGQYFNRMSDEFQKMIQFQLRRDSLNPVTKIYLYGGMSNIKGIAEYVTSLLGIDVQVISTVSKIKCSKKINIANYINAIGALIRV
jgi:type IV pilus assembly protein PilM